MGPAIDYFDFIQIARNLSKWFVQIQSHGAAIRVCFENNTKRLAAREQQKSCLSRLKLIDNTAYQAHHIPQLYYILLC